MRTKRTLGTYHKTLNTGSSASSPRRLVFAFSPTKKCGGGRSLPTPLSPRAPTPRAAGLSPLLAPASRALVAGVASPGFATREYQQVGGLTGEGGYTIFRFR